MIKINKSNIVEERSLSENILYAALGMGPKQAEELDSDVFNSIMRQFKKFEELVGSDGEFDFYILNRIAPVTKRKIEKFIGESKVHFVEREQMKHIESLSRKLINNKYFDPGRYMIEINWSPYHLSMSSTCSNTILVAKRNKRINKEFI